MPVSPSRVAAFSILLRVEKERAYASELLHSPRWEELSSADHRLATELVMGVLRWRSVLDRQIAEFSAQELTRLDVEVLVALRVAAYQMSFLDRIPRRVAVHESVELMKRAKKRSAAAFVNAVLRKFPQQRRQPKPASIQLARTPGELSFASAHPLWLVERWERAFGLAVTQQICEYDQRPPETAVYLDDANVEHELESTGACLARGPLLDSARRVLRGDVSRSRACLEGRTWIQDEGSQLVAHLVGRGERILDSCAAPGGKTRMLARRNPRGEVIAVELHAYRARLLRKLVNNPNVQVMIADARELPVGVDFDRVLIDVPCSGTGTLARNPEIKWRLQPDDLADLRAKQIAILRSGMQRVARGGKLVYSTCSLEEEENVEVVEAALAGAGDFRLLNCSIELERLRSSGEFRWKDVASLVRGPYLRTIPGVHPCDGFFAATLEKT